MLASDAAVTKRFNIRAPFSGRRSAGARSRGKAERTQWRRYGLPEDMTGKRFLEVGCWEGRNCAEAVKRGAEQVVGVDLCTSDELRRNVDEYGFEFLQMDVFSEKWLQLDTFDVVLCSGVLYHVENVLSLLSRLRRVTDELLVLETATTGLAPDHAILVLKPQEERNNPSNWWVPNKRGVFEMLKVCGFDDVAVQEERPRPKGTGSRLCVHARPVRLGSYERVLPRKAEAMSLRGGKRWQRERRAQRAGERKRKPSADQGSAEAGV
jgi:SAM-dependent methyltransferase